MPDNWFDLSAQLGRYGACVFPVSKRLTGRIAGRGGLWLCPDRECRTRKSEYKSPGLRVEDDDCDSGTIPAGRFRIVSLVTVQDLGEVERGVHAGEFDWTGPKSFHVAGRMTGITNAGLLHPPLIEEPCELCNARFALYGRLSGKITGTSNPRLEGCDLTAVYRFNLFDPRVRQSDGVVTAAQVTGTLEGAVICRCRKAVPIKR